MRDYDGFVSAWNNFGLVPDNIESFALYVLAHTEGDIVELGGGTGLLAARLATERTVTTVDVQIPIAAGNFAYLNADGNSDEFMSLLNPSVNLVGRRALCLFYTPEWMQRVEARGITTLVSQALDNDTKQMFQNSRMEKSMLVARGWKVETDLDLPFLAATR